MTAKSKKALIIGAGLSGLTSALVLAKEGFKVTILEKSSVPGLTLRGFKRKGVHFETGLHYTGGLSEKGILRPYLRYLGINDLPVKLYDQDSFDVIRFKDSQKEIKLPVGYEAMLDRLYSYFPTEKKCIKEYMEEIISAYHSSVFLPFEEAIRVSSQKAEWQESLSSFLNKRTDNQALKTVLSIHCLLHGVSPDSVSILQHARVLASYFDGVGTFLGGGKALIKRLEQELSKHGGEIFCKAEVEKIIFSEDKKFQKVQLADGREFKADLLIYTGHPFYLPDLMPEGLFRPVFAKRLKKLEDTVSAYILFAAAPKKIQALDGKNLFICTEEPLAQAFLANRKPQEGPFYISASQELAKETDLLESSQNISQKTSQGVTQSIGQNIGQNIGHNIAQKTSHKNNSDKALEKSSILAFAPGNIKTVGKWLKSTPATRPKEYKDFKEQSLKEFKKALLNDCPELADLEFLDGATPLSLRDYLSSPYGGLYGSAHSVNQYNPLPVTRAQNIFLAGQSIVAPGVIGAIISAFLSCSFIVGQEKLDKEIRKWR